MTNAWGASTDAAAFGRMAAALVATESEHLPKVTDVTVLGKRRELLLDDGKGPTLAALLAHRRATRGEAVTIVVSAARAIAALHAAGYFNVRLADDDIRFDSTGRPLLLGLSHLREILWTGPDGPAADWRALAAFAERLDLLTPGRDGSVLGARQAELGLAFASLAATESDAHLAQLEEALFDIADAAPIRFESATATATATADAIATGATARVLQPGLALPVSSASAPSGRRPTAATPGPRGAAGAERAASRSRALHRGPSASALIEAFDAGPAALFAGPIARLRAVMSQARSRTRGRFRVLLAGGAGAAALTLAMIVLLPSSRPAAGPEYRTAASTKSATGGGGAQHDADAIDATDTNSARAANDLTEADGAGIASHAAATAPARDSAADRLAGDDPVGAATVLLTRRDACLALHESRRASCFAKIANGAASGLGQPPRPLAGLTASLLERSGDSALVALTPSDPKTAPASALLMRTEAGWRLRQLYDN